MDRARIKALLVEDNPDDAHLLREYLKEVGSAQVELVHAQQLKDALKRLAEESFDVILLDLSLPDSRGIETVRRMRVQAGAVPIVVLTGLDDTEIAMQAAQEGAQDYLVKAEVNGSLLIRSMRYAIERHSMVEELKKANRTILEQQKSLVEEERLKVLVQMAGSTAHELNQPLMGLLGNIELVKLGGGYSEKLAKHIDRIEDAGRRIADIVRKIQNIRHDDTKPYVLGSSIINLDQNMNILCVEDSTDDFERIRELLKNHGQSALSHVTTIHDAVGLMEDGRVDLVLLDHVLPDGNSFDFLTHIYEKAMEIPVVVISGHGDELVASQVIQAGASDYLPKYALNEQSLSRCINNALEKVRLKKEVRLAMVRMAEMSTTDELTELHNRRYFMESLERELARATRYGSDLVLCLLDVDHLRRINYSYGRHAGDLVVAEIGRMLKESMRQSDIPCRYGGGEFAVILPNTPEPEARGVCERFRETVYHYQFEYDDNRFQTTISAGFVPCGGTVHRSPHDVLTMAREALRQAKKEGGNRARGISPVSET